MARILEFRRRILTTCRSVTCASWNIHFRLRSGCAQDAPHQRIFAKTVAGAVLRAAGCQSAACDLCNISDIRAAIIASFSELRLTPGSRRQSPNGSYGTGLPPPHPRPQRDPRNPDCPSAYGVQFYAKPWGSGTLQFGAVARASSFDPAYITDPRVEFEDETRTGALRVRCRFSVTAGLLAGSRWRRSVLVSWFGW